jgi:drug/metabolite transporter (DMT)-like permease
VTPDVGTETERFNLVGIGAAAIAVSAWGLSGVIVKNIDMGGIAAGAYRFTTYGIVIGLFMAARGQRLNARVIRGSALGGLALGIDVALFFSAVKITTVANATVIGSLQPLVVAVVAWKFFGESIAKRDMALAAVAISAVAVVVLGAGGTPGWSLRGDLLAVGAVFAWAAYFVLSKQAKGQMTPGEYTLGAALWCGLLNLAMGLAFGQDLSWPAAESWVGLLVLAFGAGILGHATMNWAIQQIPLWLSSIMTLLIPVVSASAAWIFLDEELTTIQLLAMAVVLGALAGIVRPHGAKTAAGEQTLA